jgi:hypothetical protein
MGAPLSLLALLPLALDGEAATGNDTGLAVLSLVSMVICYVGLWALWHFVFRDRSRSRRKRRGRDRS